MVTCINSTQESPYLCNSSGLRFMTLVKLYRRHLVGLIILMLTACSSSSRREEHITEGGTRVIKVQAPVLEDDDIPRLIHR